MSPTIVPSPELLDLGRGSPDQAQWYDIEVQGPNGNRATVMPVVVLRGASSHPCLSLVGGVHGNEYDGIRACQELACELSPSKLAGTIVAVPVANPFAFAAAHRRTPDDDTDLNCVFPGRPDGTLSERLAHRLVTGILGQVDFVSSLHGAMADGVLSPWIEFL